MDTHEPTSWELRIPGRSPLYNMPLIPDAFLAPSHDALISLLKIPHDMKGYPDGVYRSFIPMIVSEFCGIVWYIEVSTFSLKDGVVAPAADHITMDFESEEDS